MQSYQLIVSNSHYLIVTRNCEKFLMDTGSPMSFCSGVCAKNIFLGDKEYVINPSQTFVDNVNNSRLIEERIDGLLGMDVLCNHSFLLDRIDNTVIVDAILDEKDYKYKIPISVINLMGQKSVLLEVEINQRKVKTIVDTGAWISYLSSSYLNGVGENGTIEDYNPMFGIITTTKHEVCLSIGDYSWNVDVAKMTNQIEMVMNMMGVGLVVGLYVFASDKVCLDFINGSIFF